MTTRRSFLTSLAAASTFPCLTWADAGAPAFLAAAREPDGAYALFGLSADGADVFRIPLSDRGHAAAAHPTVPEAVAFARRPGTFAVVLNCVDGQVLRRLEAPAGRHFYGHGTFVADGAILCTTENDIETGQGRIGLWLRDDGYRRIGEIPSGGIGPHDIDTLSDDQTIVVANGGIRTDPARGREKLNLETMQPSLAYVSPDHGMQEQISLDADLHQNSIRHLAVGADDLVAFAMQWQGDPADAPPLLGLHRRGEVPRLLSADLAEQMAMQGYAGSVAINRAGTAVAITSPLGGRVHVFDADTSFRGAIQRADVCGLGAGDTGFVATDGLGGVLALRAAGITPLARSDRAWDNHLVEL